MEVVLDTHLVVSLEVNGGVNVDVNVDVSVVVDFGWMRQRLFHL